MFKYHTVKVMSHEAQRVFCSRMKELHPEHFKDNKVLDIGSLDINGNNKFLFDNSEYIGLDIAEGNNVDVVCIGHEYDAPDETFDTIISTEALEHDMYYEKTILNAIRMLKKGGALVLTCASTFRPEHGTPRTDGSWAAPLLKEVSEEWANYYKNLDEDDLKRIPGFVDTFPDGIYEYNHNKMDMYFFGIKK